MTISPILLNNLSGIEFARPILPTDQAIASGAITSGMIGDAAVLSGTIGSGQLASGHMASGFIFNLTNTATLQSGQVSSGYIASGSVDGFFGPSRRIQSGTVGVFDFGSGAVIAGTVGSGAVQSGNIASGSIGNNHIASGAINSGDISSGAVVGAAGAGRTIASGTVAHPDFGSGAVQSGDIASGQIGPNHLASGVLQSVSGTIQTAARLIIDDFSAGGTPLITEETVSGMVAVSITQSGRLRIAMPGVSGRMPAVGITVSGVASGLACTFYTDGFVQLASGAYNFSGFVGQPAYIARSGQIAPLSGGFLSGGFLSGDIPQRVGVIVNSGTIRLSVDPFTKDAIQSPPGTFWIQSGDIASGGIGTNHLSSGAVNSGQIASGQVTNFKMGSGAINSGHIGSGAVIGSVGGGAFTIASGSIGPNDIGSGAILSGNLGSGQISNFKMASGAINSGHMGSGSVVGAAGAGRTIASGTLAHPDFGSGAVQSGDIASGQISTNHFASGAQLTAAARVQDNLGFTAVENISGGLAVSVTASGFLQIAMAGQPTRMPAIGISETNIASGSAVTPLLVGRALLPIVTFSGFVGQPVWVGQSGLIVSLAPSSSGFVQQRMGVAINGSGLVCQPDPMTVTIGA